MNIIKKKYGLSFGIAVTMHLAIIALFGLNLTSDSELVKQKTVPEIIQASILDDDKIQQEADRLKAKEKNKQSKNLKQQKKLENNRKKEQQLLLNAKKKRLQEEKKAKELKKKNKQLAIKEKQKLEKIKQRKALEAKRLAKIKAENLAEKKRLDDLRQAEEEKQQAILAKQQADAAKKVAAEKAKQEHNRQATITATTAIQRKVNNRWIRPLSSIKGLNCTIRVKLLPSGDVMNASVVRSSGDSIFDRSAENAVRKASPLPVPKDRALFTKKFRSFTFEFKPE